MLHADGDVIVPATGRTHSISRDEFDLKGRMSFAPLSAGYGWLRGGKPLEQKNESSPPGAGR